METIGRRANVPWRVIGWGTVAFLLLLPLVTRAPWTASDYIFAAVMMGTVGVGLELAFRKTASMAFRAAAGLALGAGFLTIWVTGAVGIIANEDDAPNLLYLGAVLLGILGAVAARFRSDGLSVAAGLAGVATLLVPVISLAAWPQMSDAIWSPEVPIATLVLTGMWLLSAALFRKAASDRLG